MGRLGQSKDVLAKRFCFRDSMDSQVVTLHRKLRSGSASLTNGDVPARIFKLLCEEPTSTHGPRRVPSSYRPSARKKKK